MPERGGKKDDADATGMENDAERGDSVIVGSDDRLVVVWSGVGRCLVEVEGVIKSGEDECASFEFEKRWLVGRVVRG